MHDLTAYWNDEKCEASVCDSIDISIAVATEKVLNWNFPGSNIMAYMLQVIWLAILLQGLMTPIIRNADQKTLSAISSEVLLTKLELLGFLQ